MCIFRFSSVDPGNIVRLLLPDVGLLVSTLFILRLCRKLLRPMPQVNLHENGIPPSDPQVTTRLSTAIVTMTQHYPWGINHKAQGPESAQQRLQSSLLESFG